MKERRKHPRKEENLQVEINLDNTTIQGNVRNISQGGLLIQLDEKERSLISEGDIGKEVILKINKEQTDNDLYEGRIIRVVEEKQQKYIAVFFLQK